MRPKKFGKKPEKTSPERFRRTTRVTSRIKNIANSFKGTDVEKARQIINFVMHQRPHDPILSETRKKLIFKKNADKLAARREPADLLHCAERCTLALALLNSVKIPSWLVRQINFKRGIHKAEFHDYVELFINGRVHTIQFFKKHGVIIPGIAQKVVHYESSFFFRGADSKQIEGIDSYRKYEKFRKNFENSIVTGLNQDYDRINLLVKNGIIPKEAYKEIMSG
jgi:hypothetical protein